MVQSMRTRAVTAVAFAVSAALAVVLAGGCEVLVPDTVPTFGCTGTNANVCPASQICAPSLGKCIDRSHACTIVDSMCPPGTHCNAGTQMCDPDGSDASGGDDGGGTDASAVDAPLPPADGNLPDLGPIDSGKCTTVGCPCTRNGDCDSDICADSTILTSVDTTGKVCTKPCCASSDCPTDFVCFAPGTGGNYCVTKTMLSRPNLGNVPGGGTCATNEVCRSGKCGSAGLCLDACCTTNSSTPIAESCAAGSQCALDSQTGHTVLQCTGNSGTKINGDSCSSSGTPCHGAACESDPTNPPFNECLVPCCSTPSCGSGFACFDIQNVGQMDWFPLCSQPTGNDTDGQPLTIGSGAMGATCNKNRDCRSVHCLGGRCSDVCCTDADCAAVSGWKCQPTITAGTNGVFLRCGTPL
jgi:hypothetical protein